MVQQRVEAINVWAARVGQELLGRLVLVQQYRQGIGRTTRRKKNQPVEIEVSDAPVTSGHPHGEEIMKGIALHEIGHHLADMGQRGHSATRGIARSEGLGEIYDVLLDERLERLMRSRRPKWGAYFDRLASYAFAQTTHRVPLSDFAKFMGLPPHRTRQRISAGKLPGRLVPGPDAEHKEMVLLRDSDFLSVPGAVPPLAAFAACLRCGFAPALCADARIAKAMALVPSNLKDLPHAEVLKAARRIGDLIGRSDAHKRRMRAWLQRARLHRATMRALREALQRMVEAGQVPEWMRREAAGIRKNKPLPVELRVGEPPAGRQLNLGEELEFDELPNEKALAFDANEYARLVAPIRKHVRTLRQYFERLGVHLVDEYAQKRGRRLDMGRVRHGIVQRSPRILLNSREEIAPDLYLGVLIDRSGSMREGNKIEKAKAFAALVAESARGLRGISGHVNAFDDKTFFRLGDLDHPAIAALESGEGNNDAGALSRAAELAWKSGKKNRLLVMISDGSPTECTVESLKDLVEQLTRRDGLVCAQIAVEEMDEVCFPHFVDLSKYPLDEAVGRFGRLLMKLTEPWR